VDHYFERPILNSPYAYPGRHWELDQDGQVTDRIIENRRRSELITPVPKPKKRRHTNDGTEARHSVAAEGGGGMVVTNIA
jgi:hypothetical protein